MHDYLVATGGAEKVFQAIAEMFPNAPIYTGIYRPATAMPYFADRDIRPLWSDRLPVNVSTFRLGFAAFAAAFERCHLEGYDLVVSSSSGFGHAAGSHARRRVNYCHTPPRFVWPCGASSEADSPAARAAAAVSRPILQRLDRRAARRIDVIVANSEVTRARIRQFYGRDSTVLHPAVDRQAAGAEVGHGDYFLTVGRLVPYKRFDDAVVACTRAGRELTVVGAGREDRRLRSLAGPTVTFVGNVSEARLASLYAGARALLLPGEDDFGMTAIEANTQGTPVIAARRGGYLETVVDGVTGLLFEPGDPRSLEQAINRFESISFDPAVIRAHAQQFSSESFRRRLSGIIAGVIESAPVASL